MRKSKKKKCKRNGKVGMNIHVLRRSRREKIWKKRRKRKRKRERKMEGKKNGREGRRSINDLADISGSSFTLCIKLRERVYNSIMGRGESPWTTTTTTTTTTHLEIRREN